VAANLIARDLPSGGGAVATVLDSSGNVFVTGPGQSPTAGAAQTEPGGGTCTSISRFPIIGPCSDAQITKFDGTGKLVFSTLLGGNTADSATALVVDSEGSVYFAGVTGGGLPTTANAAIASTGGTFIAKVSADGREFRYVSYLPQSMTAANGLAVDAHGNAIVAGACGTHACAVKINPAGSVIAYLRPLAGSGHETANAIAVDLDGNAVIAGRTTSADFPVTGDALQSRLAGEQNAFLTKVDPAGNPVFSTFLGGSGTDDAHAVQTDAAGNIYIAGYTSSLDFPTAAGSFQPVAPLPLWNDFAPGGFAARLSPDGKRLAWSTYVMSVDRELQTGMTLLAVTESGDAYVSGLTGVGFPVTASAPRPCFSGPMDAFVAHLDSSGALRDATYVGDANLLQALRVNADGTVLTAWHNAGPAVHLATLRFDGTPASCLSRALLNVTTLQWRGHVTPGEFVTLSGFGIGPETGVAWDGQGTPPSNLGGVQVFFDSRPAPVVYTQSRQINVLVPFEVAADGFTAVRVTYNGLGVGSVLAATGLEEPGLFRAEPGVSNQALAMNQDGTRNSSTNPAPVGSLVTVWGTGFGQASPSCPTGGLNPSIPGALIRHDSLGFDGGVTVVAAGGDPGSPCGVDRMTLRIAATLGQGALRLAPGQQVGSVIYVK
jgi:uncharacterized protein (TIGR03437 family)